MFHLIVTHQGDGSSNWDNEVRAHIAFKAIIPLSDSDKLKLFKKLPPQNAIYDNNTEACYYIHPDGLEKASPSN